MRTHTMTTLINIRLYVCSVLCWMLLVSSALGTEGDTETKKPEVMSVVSETLIGEIENGEKIELCVWQYYDQDHILCKVEVQQMNSTVETYWISRFLITFLRDLPENDENCIMEYINVSFLGHQRLLMPSIPAIGGDFCNEYYKLASEKNEFIVQETMKHYMGQEHSPNSMSICIVLTDKKGRYVENMIIFNTELQNLKD